MGISLFEFDHAFIEIVKTGIYNPAHASHYKIFSLYKYVVIEQETESSLPGIRLTREGEEYFKTAVAKNKVLLGELNEVMLSIGHKCRFQPSLLPQYNCLKVLGYVQLFGITEEENFLPEVISTLAGIKYYNQIVTDGKRLEETEMMPQLFFKKRIKRNQ